MGKTRDLFKKIRDTKGTFHIKMASVKDRDGKGYGHKRSAKKQNGCLRRICEKEK